MNSLSLSLIDPRSLLSGRVAIVTGAGSGIGLSSAHMLAAHGANVILSDIDLGKVQIATDRMKQIGLNVCAFKSDVRLDKDLERLVDFAVAKFGSIDVLHSHAGVQVEGNLEQVEPDGFDLSWNLNVRSHFMLARLIMPHMRSRGGGSIIVTASNSGVQFDREMIAYATSKHAVVAMVKQIAADYARYNIRVNALCPGWVDTPFNAPFMKQMGGRAELETYIKEKIPMGRWATTEEIAEAVVFLASSRSSFMTGQALVVDGGECL